MVQKKEEEKMVWMSGATRFCNTVATFAWNVFYLAKNCLHSSRTDGPIVTVRWPFGTEWWCTAFTGAKQWINNTQIIFIWQFIHQILSSLFSSLFYFSLSVRCCRIWQVRPQWTLDIRRIMICIMLYSCSFGFVCYVSALYGAFDQLFGFACA